MCLYERLKDGNPLRGTEIKPISASPSATIQDTPYTDQTMGITIHPTEIQNAVPQYQPPERCAGFVSSTAANHPTPPKSKKNPTSSPLKNPTPTPPTPLRNLSDILEPPTNPPPRPPPTLAPNPLCPLSLPEPRAPKPWARSLRSKGVMAPAPAPGLA